jgi:aspartate 1-decarboxylase
MLVNICKSKIHRATVTETELSYIGSITIDENLLDASGMLPYERVQVLNHNNGERLETYIIVGERGSGIICLNGPAARRGVIGDMVTVIAYAWLEEDEARGWKPTVVLVDDRNQPTGEPSAA